MVEITIKKGKGESKPYTLAHLQVAAVLSPPTPGENLKVAIYGSFDNITYGPVVIHGNGPVAFETKGFPQMSVFNPRDFAGIMYLKFVLEGYKAKEDLPFAVYLQESR